VQRSKDFHKLFSDWCQAHTNCSIRNLLSSEIDHNQSKDFRVSGLCGRFPTSECSLYLISTLGNIYMLAFLLISGFKQWGQKALHLEQIPSLNIDHFLFRLFHIFIPRSDDEAVLISLFLCWFAPHLSCLLFLIFQVL